MANVIEKVAKPFVKLQNLFFDGLQRLIMKLANLSVPEARIIIITHSARRITQIFVKSIDRRKISLRKL